MENEIWYPIKGYEELYEVSSFGRVRSLNYHLTGQTKLLSPVEASNGYLMVNLYKNGKRKFVTVHRLVAETFLPNWGDEPQVNHKDENPENNRVDNLEWCSAKYNSNFGTRNQRMVEKQSKPVLQFTKTGELVREWPSTREAGRNGFDDGAVCKCCNGKLKTHKGYVWRYKEVI